MSTPERIDLHVHSHHSDGTLAPAALVDMASQREVQWLALTDHDTVSGCAEAAAACDAAAREGRFAPRFVHGIELTSGWRGREIHVVGLDLDSGDAGLAAHVESVRTLRRTRLQRIGARLDAAGLPGTQLADGVLAGDASATRMHLARALVAAGHARDAQDAFDRWLGAGQPGHVPSEWPTVAAAIQAIVAAGGLPVLAHAQRYKLSSGGLRELVEHFRDSGGAGIEVSIAGISPGDADRLGSLARRYDLYGSVASDFHEPGVPWRPLGRFAKLPDGIRPIQDELRQRHP